jgi:serine phosphatase RsbU (regulator of sigma subunit)
VPERAPAQVSEIVIHAPDGSSRTVPLEGAQLTLGRVATNELCFPDDPGLSRRHLTLERQGSNWVVRDLGSSNGTFVNGRQISRDHVLHPGDWISAGQLLIEFRDGSPARPPAVSFVETGPMGGDGTTIVTDLKNALDEPAVAAADSVRVRGVAPVQALIRAGQELSGHLSLPDLFRLILDLSIEAVGATRGLLMTIEGSELVVQAARGGEFQISSGVRDRVLKERASLLVYDALGDADLRLRESIVSQSIRSILAVPLQTAASVIGLIYVDAAGLLQTFTKDHLSLLTVMANIAAIRIEQARLLEVERVKRIQEHELSQAAEIQAQLLPSAPPEMPGIELCGRNLPCRTVGGDYFDYFKYPDGRLALLVGDVSGKGMPAALLMSSLQARLQVLSEAAPPPASLVTRLNAGLTAKCPGNRFVTFFFSVLDPETGELEYCNAGHNPPMLIRSDGSIETLETGGMVLGLVGVARYEEGRAKLEKGDVLVLYSDGVTEATPLGSEDEFGEERLAAAVRAGGDKAVQSVIDDVIRQLRGWSAGAPFADDVTLVVVRRPV